MPNTANSSGDSASRAASRSSRDLEALTSLRGIFAILVVLYHFTKLAAPDWSPAGFGLLGRGYLAVDFFFVLSGFIIAHAYGRAFQEKVTGAGYVRFVAARIGRIYPLHLLVLAFLVAVELARYIHGPTGSAEFVQAFSTPAKSWPAVLSNIALVQSLHVHPGLTWNGPAWSISTEFYVYLLFPLLVRAMVRLRSLPSLAALGACLVGLLYLLVALDPATDRAGPLDITYDFGYLRCLLEFCLGMVVYRAYSGGELVAAGNDIVTLAVATGLTIVLQLHWHDLLVVPLIALLILSVSQNRGMALRLLTFGPLVLLGEISYSVYLIHEPVRDAGLMALRRLSLDPEHASLSTPQGALLVGGLIVLVLALSYITWRWIETPARDYVKRRVAGRMRDSKPSPR